MASAGSAACSSAGPGVSHTRFRQCHWVALLGSAVRRHRQAAQGNMTGAQALRPPDLGLRRAPPFVVAQSCHELPDRADTPSSHTENVPSPTHWLVVWVRLKELTHSGSHAISTSPAAGLRMSAYTRTRMHTRASTRAARAPGPLDLLVKMTRELTFEVTEDKLQHTCSSTTLYPFPFQIYHNI